MDFANQMRRRWIQNAKEKGGRKFVLTCLSVFADVDLDVGAVLLEGQDRKIDSFSHFHEWQWTFHSSPQDISQGELINERRKSWRTHFQPASVWYKSSPQSITQLPWLGYFSTELCTCWKTVIKRANEQKRTNFYLRWRFESVT